MPFTADGSEALEHQITLHMETVRQAVIDAVGPDGLQALILGGGYGRGEGGVYVVDGEERVYNDYDFFVIVSYDSRRRRKDLADALAKVKAAVEPGCGIHVDFSPAMPLSTLPGLPYELMFMELKAGHHVVIGPPNILDALPDYDPSHPPLEEGTRLFMNRGVGLLLARQTLQQGVTLNTEDHEFVVRNIQKAVMAMGDSVLFHNGTYSPSYCERRDRVLALDSSALPGGDALRDAYRRAMAFKLRPEHSVPEGLSLVEWHQAVTTIFEEVFLWYERHRLQSPAMTWEDYTSRGQRLPALNRHRPWINVIRNVRRSGKGLPPLRELALHPRDRLLARLPRLLFQGEKSPEEEALVYQLWENYG